MNPAGPASRIRRRDVDGDERLEETFPPYPASHTADAAMTDASQPAPATDPAGVQPLPEQMRKKPRLSPRNSIGMLAKVELQLCLQFLDTKSKLIAARCSRQLLHAADHPFVWQGSTVAFCSRRQPQLGSLIRQSLLRHAPIALGLDCDLSVAEVAAIPNLLELFICDHIPVDRASQLLMVPPLQGLQTLHVYRPLPGAALQLLPTLPVLRTLELVLYDCAGWRWLPAMPALTNLDLWGVRFDLEQLALDAIGQCARLQSLRLERPYFGAGDFARLCSTPAMRQLRHLTLALFQALGRGAHSAQYGEGLSALAGLESLDLEDVSGIGTLLPHLIHAPALRTLSVACEPCDPNDGVEAISTIPSHEVLQQLLTAAPDLEVRLEVAASLDEWRHCWQYTLPFVSAPDREQMDEQWRELQRMCAEMERVTIIKK